jgi:integrase
MAKKPRRPKIIVMGRVRVRAIRGPREDGRWYWRAETYAGDDSATIWTGWGTEEEAARNVGEKVAKGDLTPRPRQGSGPITLGLVLDRWLAAQEARSDLKWRTSKAYRVNVSLHLVPHLRDVDVTRIDRRTLETYRDRRSGEGAAGRTIRAELEVLGTAWRWAQEMGAVPDRALPHVEVVVRPVRSRKRPSLGELARVIAKARPRWVALMIQMLAGTGARIGEIATVTWADIDLTEAVVRVNDKTGPREVPIGQWLVDALEQAKAANPTALNPFGRGSGYIRKHFVTFLRRACGEAEVGYFTPHGMRRAAVDTFAREGVDIATAAVILGHSPEVMLKHYREVTVEDRKAAIQRVRLGEIPPPETPAGQVLDLDAERQRRSR